MRQTQDYPVSHFFQIVILILLLAVITRADKVGALLLEETQLELSNKTIHVPGNVVALSEELNVSIPDGLFENEYSSAPSIFFILDNSGSMFWEGYEMDRDANRFKVTRAFIDSIYARAPEANIGLSVFSGENEFLWWEDPILDRVEPNGMFSYVPLLTLNDNYFSERTDSSKGVDILKAYLETRDTSIILENGSNYEWTSLDYQTQVPGGTNITTGFDAALRAFENAPGNKESHFIIFISDGDATRPKDNEDERIRFIEGENVPTTFTIFFSEDNTVPESIEKMTENITQNGYSQNNSSSAFWPFTNSGEDELMEFLMTEVLPEIELKQSKSVTEVYINELLGSEWNTNYFGFDNKIPLDDISSSFTISTAFSLIDTAMWFGEQLVQSLDTTVQNTFYVLIDSTLENDDDLNIEWWERSISLVEAGDEIKNLSSLHERVEFKFSEEKIDIYYGYDSINVEFRGKESGDLLNYTLAKDDNDLFHDLEFTTAEFADKYDDVLQLNREDTVIVTFRNPNLPLDTMEVQIPYRQENIILLDDAAYFDVNADGLVDSITLSFTSQDEISFDEKKEIVENYTTFKNRTIEIREILDHDDGVSLLVYEYDNLNTSTEDDYVFLEEKTLSNGSSTAEIEISVEDKMAPVILENGAVLKDSLNGLGHLTVEFSEEVDILNDNENPFVFSQGQEEYLAELEVLEIDGSIVTFHVTHSEREAGADNDSIKIDALVGTVDDMYGNIQENTNNVSREVDVQRVLPPLDLEANAVTPYKLHGTEVPENLALTEFELDQGESGEYTGMIVTVSAMGNVVDAFQKYTISARITIKDYLGTTIVEQQPLVLFDNYNSLIYVWNGKNRNGRIVGSGSYSAVIQTSVYDDESGEEREAVFKLLLGVQK